MNIPYYVEGKGYTATPTLAEEVYGLIVASEVNWRKLYSPENRSVVIASVFRSLHTKEEVLSFFDQIAQGGSEWDILENSSITVTELYESLLEIVQHPYISSERRAQIGRLIQAWEEAALSYFSENLLEVSTQKDSRLESRSRMFRKKTSNTPTEVRKALSYIQELRSQVSTR